MTDIQEFRIVYPFVRCLAETYLEPPEPDASGPFEVRPQWIASWRPGVEIVDLGDHPYGGSSLMGRADAEGFMVLRDHGSFKPAGKFLSRTFYTRTWIDPDGRAFGKAILRVCSTAAFTRMKRGYRHAYDVDDVGRDEFVRQAEAKNKEAQA